MNIYILTVGTRGDVQPFVALGKGLQAAGHTVTICTSQTFASLITAHGLQYAYMNDEIIRFIDSDAGRRAMEDADNIVAWMKIAVELTQQIKPVYRRMLEEAWASAQPTAGQKIDAILYHPKALGGYDLAEKLDIPGFLTLPFPAYVPTREFPAVVFPEWQIGGWYNKASYLFTTKMAQATMGGVINSWRQETLQLPKRPVMASELIRKRGHHRGDVPVLHCYSPHVLPTPADWPKSAVTTGYWFLEQQHDWQPSADLKAFLDAGPPPVYVGFGSISGRDPATTTQLIVDALVTTGQRGLIATGWGGLDSRALPPSIHKIDAAPHDWLFPRVAAVIHHGGAGTTAAGLRAGKPTIICPFFGDQPFWGRRVATLGVGPQPIPQKKLTVERLTAAINVATTDRKIQARAAALGEKIRAENGIGKAVALIELWSKK